MAKKSTVKTKYENNPFFVAANGITLLFDAARGISGLLLGISLLTLFMSGLVDDGKKPDPHAPEHLIKMLQGWSTEQWLFAIGAGSILTLAFMMISALFGGVSSYTSYRLSQGENVAIRDAFRHAFDRLWSFLWLQILMFVKVALWSLLLIIPGVIMAFRYSLAGVVFFDNRKNLRGNAALQESARLTKGGWLTTFASNALFSFLTFGALSPVISTSVNTILYRQFDTLDKKNKPEAHWLSWAVTIFALIATIFGLAYSI